MSAFIYYKTDFVDVYTLSDRDIHVVYDKLWSEGGVECDVIEAKTRREWVCKYVENYQSKWQLSFIF
jgi:hypothetical protein